MDPMTETTPTPTPLPPDPVQYDATRNVIARRKGLEQPYIVGGQDPDLPDTLRKERPYVQVLFWMVAVIIALGFVLGFIGAIIGSPAA